jgi:hypothetical protein
MKGDQKIIPKDLVVTTHKWKPKHMVGYDAHKKALGKGTPRHFVVKKPVEDKG